MSEFWVSDFVHPLPPTGTGQLHTTATDDIYSRSRPHSWSQGSGNIDMHDFVVNNPIMQNVSNYSFAGNAMKPLEKRLMRGAEFDSSARDPPPRCHPGTRLSITGRIQQFLNDGGREKRMLWLVGPAGVGKSAIMQTIAETASNVTLGASLFFAVNQRDDPSKVFTTLAYQIAIKHPPYREFILQEITLDPLLPEKAMSRLFTKFFVEPFVQRRIYHGLSPLLILIDGLDECKGESKQREILGLISYFCLTYPTAPLIWVIASRPEPQISTFLSLPKVSRSYVKEEVVVDSDEACRDVERYLRKGFGLIRTKHALLSLFSHWPAEHDFCQIAVSSSGMFAFASTVIRYVDDSAGGNPVLQLQQVLEVIGYARSRPREGGPNPLAGLDALYDYILSLIPPNVLLTAKKLLLVMVVDGPYFNSFGSRCNYLGISPDVAYGSLRHLHSVVKICPPDQAFNEAEETDLAPHHRSFMDYLTNPARSTLFADYKHEASLLYIECTTRIMKDIPGDILTDPTMHVTLSWPCSDPNDKTREDIYSCASEHFLGAVAANPESLRDPDVIHALRVLDPIAATYARPDGFCGLFFGNPYNWPILIRHQIFQEVPIRRLNLDNLIFYTRSYILYRSKRPDAPWPPASWKKCKCGNRGVWNFADKDLMSMREYPTVWLQRTEGGCCGSDTIKVIGRAFNNSPDDLVAVGAGVGLEGRMLYHVVDNEDERASWIVTYIITFRIREEAASYGTRRIDCILEDS